MEFSKLNAPSLKELFIQELENMILSGKLAVGEKLPSERELAESMQVSRAVVNSGISVLARKGFLTIRPRVGTFVSDYRRNGTMETLISIMNYNSGILRDDEIRSLLQIKLAVDTLSVRLSVPKITKDELHLLKTIVKNIGASSSPAEASNHAFAFEHELAIISGNTLIPLIFRSFKVPALSLWQRYCELYGIESLYQNINGLYMHLNERDADKAVEYIMNYITEAVRGKKTIYY